MNHACLDSPLLLAILAILAMRLFVFFCPLFFLSALNGQRTSMFRVDDGTTVCQVLPHLPIYEATREQVKAAAVQLRTHCHALMATLGFVQLHLTPDTLKPLHSDTQAWVSTPLWVSPQGKTIYRYARGSLLNEQKI